MRRHAKAPSSGSSTRQGSGLGALTIAAASVLALAACLGIGAPAALAAVPTATVGSAEVGFTSARATGTIDPGGSETSYHYEYISEAKYAENLAHGNPGFSEGVEAAGFNSTSSAGAAEPAELAGLAADSTYRLRLVAENADGSTTSPTTLFTTQATTPAPVTIDPAGTPAFTTVNVSGTVDPEGGNVNQIVPPGGSAAVPIAWEFEVNREGHGWEFASGQVKYIYEPTPGEEITAESTVIEGKAAESSEPITVEEKIQGLAPGASYEVRLRSFRANTQAVSAEPFESFTTLAVSPPVVTVNDADSVTATTAHFTGTVVSAGAESLCIFEFISEPALQHNLAEGKPGFQGAGNQGCSPAVQFQSVTPKPVEASISGLESRLTLEPNQTYHFRLVARQQFNGTSTTTADAPHTFTTLAVPPSAHTTYAGQVGATSAIIRGFVNPHNSATTYHFLWGTSDCSANPCQSIPVSQDADAGSGGTQVAARQTLTGLQPETTYHYLLVATNSAGTTEGEDQAFTTTATSSPSACPNEARRAEQPLSFVLGDCRAWEFASPGATADVMADTSRTVAAATESSGLPMAAKFSSLDGFGEVHGSGIGFDYLAQRSGEPGTSGWTIQGISPPQEQLSYLTPTNFLDPVYETFSPDLTRGIFRSWSPLTNAGNVAEVPNLYMRDDVRASGLGAYELLTDSATLQPPISDGKDRPWFAGVSKNLEHVVFESRLNLTQDATGNNPKLYKSDDGIVRLVKAGPACAGGESDGAPCSIAGIGAIPEANGHTKARYTPRVISADGSRVDFTSPFGVPEGTVPNPTPGVVSRLFQLDDRGTLATDDDAVIPLSMSEKALPEVAHAATYETASTDGNRVFFLSKEQLTDTPGSGLYMWERKGTDEKQSLAIDATGGSFTLTAHTQPSWGAGTLASGSSEITGVTGSFTVGQTIAGNGIEPGTTVTAVDPGGTTITLSAPAMVDGEESLSASIEATTDPLPWNASSVQVQTKLEGLGMIGTGNVAVTGGPGGGAPHVIEFTGALAGVDVMQLTSDASGLSGGASTANVSTTDAVHNLTLIGPDATGVFGASDDGHRLYFSKHDDIWYWQDVDGSPSGSFSKLATLAPSDNRIGQFPTPVTSWNTEVPPLSRVTPDGRTLLFAASDGAGIAPGYQHGKCQANHLASDSGLCTELYVYRADRSTPGHPDIVCASCNLEVPGAPGDTVTYTEAGRGVASPTAYENRSLSDNGSYVFFDTEKPLVPEDTNGVLDAYEYDVNSGEVHLLSSGTDPAPSYFLDASDDGSDVFITTRQQLSRWDDDHNYDLYDVRADGGFPEPSPPPPNCSGDSCHSAAPTTPPATSPGSSTLVGPVHTCPRGTRRARGKKGVRCAKPRHHHKRSANHNRRAGR